MPALKNVLHDNDHESAQAVDGNEGTKQESRIDKLPLRERPVNNFQQPSQKAINGEKYNIIKKA